MRKLVSLQAARYLLVFLVGVLAGLGLPYWLIQNRVLPPYLPAQFEIDPLFRQTEVAGLILIENEQDVLAKRQAVIDYVWGAAGWPEEVLPERVEADISDEQYQGLANLKQIDRLTIEMTWQVRSIAYHFVPRRSNQKLVIYHQGHYGDFIFGRDVIERLVAEEYHVIALAMPLLGPNNQPVVTLPRLGRIKVSQHDQLKLLPLAEGAPIQFFLQPVAVVMNYVQPDGFEAIYMMGLSGGGWTATLYGAIDPRIRGSYQVAGTLPIYLRRGSSRDWGDYEQTIPELYRMANYLELYVMAGHGEGRRHGQILNKYDPCCYGGIRYQTYEAVVKARLAQVGTGRFEVYLDETVREHKISEWALDLIVADMHKSG